MTGRKLLALMGMTFATATAAQAQDGYNQRAKKYVEQYAEMAMSEQRISGIPASITLGQGILETEAGNSELFHNANNHFGIKSKSDWKGETYTYTDDAPNELFKKYKDAQESFHDHSEHLHRNPRYAPLFKIPVTNYKGWAVTIRKCGYATDPKYAQRLIKIIEEFSLANYTELALKEPAPKHEMTPAVQQATATAVAVPVKQEVTPLKVDIANPAVVKTEPVIAKAEPIVAKAPEATPVAKPIEAAKPAEVSKPAEIAPPAPQLPVMQKPGSKIIIHTSDGSDAGIQGEAGNTSKLNISHETEADYFAAVPPADTSKVTTVNGLRAFPAKKGDMLLKYAVQYKVRYPQLLEMNDLPDAPLAFDCYIYLEKKSATGIRDRHMVKDGETLLMIAQEEGIQLKRLMAFNHLNSKDEPVNGAILELQTPATSKPEVKVTYVPAAHHGNAIGAAPPINKGDYITLRKDKLAPPDKPRETVKEVASTSPPPTDKAPKENKLKNIINRIKNNDSTIAKTSTPTNTAINTSADASIATADDPIEADMEAMAPFMVYMSGEQTDILTNASMQWIKPENDPPKVVEHGNAISPAELAKLKAELDPIVYADDSKLIAANPAKAPTKTAIYYTVKKGETATMIARKYNISVSDLLKWNNIAAGDIKPGQDLKVSE